ncbi:MAG TPA: sigma-70 family RNA polymerase sigma factor [Ktedonobacterales bacterium]|nr:sigma-70 family RNA polymerase sigma factor [Ktedonobacterales bacterium]
MGDQSRGSHRLSHEEFACLVDHHQHRLYAFLHSLIGNAEQAFDLVQDTFYDAWRVAQRGDPPFVSDAEPGSAQRWLFRAGYNNALSLLRRRRRIRWESLDQLDESHPSFEDLSGAFDEQLAESEALQTALAQLAPQDVACLLLRIVYGFNAAEVGAILHTSPDNVNTRLTRAKQRLRAAYLQHTAPEEQIRR